MFFCVRNVELTRNLLAKGVYYILLYLYIKYIREKEALLFSTYDGT